MVIRSKAPLRIGLAGGGTDVAPYSDTYGGSILNATISLHAYANICPLPQGSPLVFHSTDLQILENCPSISDAPLVLNSKLNLLKGAYAYLQQRYALPTNLSFELTTHVDAPAGSGLGTSSTLMVAILGAFAEWLQIPFGEYDLAHLAYLIEREDMQMAGGKQDQYAATFGGVNFMEFYNQDKVIVNPLRIKQEYINELENNLLLFFTSTSRLSSSIIEAQAQNVVEKNVASIEAMHKLKEQAILMKEALLRGKIDEIGKILDFGWQHKKQMAKGISNSQIEEIYEAALRAGSTGGKISGAGGGGFMIFYCPKNTRFEVIKALQRFGGEVKKYEFTQHGLTTWAYK